MAEFEVNGIKLNIDFMDADQAEKAEDAILSAKAASEKFAKQDDMRGSEAIRKFCKITSDCYDTLFGSGTGEKVLGGKKNILVAMDVLTALVDERDRQESEITQKVQSWETKYSPNRLNRRHPPKK